MNRNTIVLSRYLRIGDRVVMTMDKEARRCQLWCW